MASPRIARKVLLVGWDAADWKFIHPLLDAGELPNLQRLVDEGVIGNIATLNPCLSPILWTSIATGKTADKHGICGFVEPNPDGPGVRLSTSTSRTTKAIWNILSQRELRSIVVGWYASHPAEPIRGVCVSNRFDEAPPTDLNQPWPIPPGSVFPTEMSQAIAELRLHPAELQFPEMAAFLPSLMEIDFRTDPRPFKLATAIAHTASIHNVATALMESEPWDFFAVYYDALDVVGHDFMPFHPPRLPHVTEHDFGQYSGVMQALYVFHDQMLGRLLELAGSETTVVLVSDHGFHSDHLRPHTWEEGHNPESQAAAWHRPYGMFVLRGDHISQDERIYGANLLDVTPTILRLFGLPRGEDMDGRVLLDAFDHELPPLDPIPSWDQEPGESYLHPANLRQDPYVSHAAIQQLVELGYLPRAAEDVERSVEIAKAEAKFNLASVHLHHGRAARAKEILEALCEEHPDQPRYAVKLIRACFELGLYEQADAKLLELDEQGVHTADSDLVAIALRLQRGQFDDARARLNAMESRYPMSAGLQYMVGQLFLAQGQWFDAQKTFEKGITLDADMAQCHQGLAHALLEQGHPQAAAESAVQAIGLLYFFPQAHYQLGRALVELGETARALQALQIAVAQAPHFHDAHRALAKLYEQLRQPRLAMRHHRLADGFPDTE